jgi:hypothetical protein
MASDDDGFLEALRARVRAAPRKPMWEGDQPKPRPPATAEEIERAEVQLGFELPNLLGRVYEEVADGDFGPTYGLLPLLNPRRDQDATLANVRSELALDPRRHPLLLPVCDWGCAIWSCLDCRTEEGPIVTMAGEWPLTNTGHDLRSWLQAWLDGTDLWNEMFEPSPTRTGINPFTKQPIEIKVTGTPRGSAWP